jgi:large subunit ribosomal protein L22
MRRKLRYQEKERNNSQQIYMQVSAKLNNFRKSPRKVRLVAGLLKGLPAKEAQNHLKFIVKGSALNFEKLLKSAVSNAENNFGLDKENLFVKDVIVNEGSKLKRWLPRAYGRASLILKRTSNIEIIVAEVVPGKGRKKVVKQEIKEVKGKPEIAKKKETEKTEEIKEEKKEIVKERAEKEFIDEKKKAEGSKGFLKRVFRRKSM